MVLLYNVASHWSWEDLNLFWGVSVTTLPIELPFYFDLIFLFNSKIENGGEHLRSLQPQEPLEVPRVTCGGWGVDRVQVKQK